MKKINRRIVAASVLCLSTIAAGAQTKAQLDSMRAEYQRGIQAEKEEYDQYRQQAIEEYQMFEKALKAEYEEYVKSIKNVWGNNNMREDTKKEWVEYGKDKKSRSIVDFEKGKVRIEVALDNANENNPKVIEEKMSQAIESLLKSKGSTIPFESTVDKKKNVSKTPIMEGLVNIKNYEEGIKKEKLKSPSKNDEAKVIAKVIAKETPKQTTRIRGNDKKERKVVAVEMDLVPDKLSKCAAQYKDDVKRYSGTFKIEQPLIFAVIEQESSFNPKAVSPVKAYGLMQLMPKLGGLDAYRYVYKKNEAPSPSYLFVPHQNIELGTAYLRILMNLFSKVEDPDCRRLCAIAAYNTGAGNVCRAFTGKTNISQAVKEINKYSYSELYNYLTKRLHADEARKYVSGVSKKREKYMK